MPTPRPLLALSLILLLTAPAQAWVPQLDETSAKAVIDSAYSRRDPVPTYLSLNLEVKDGAFVAGQAAVTTFDGGDACLADWLAAPGDFARGSRPLAVTASGQADGLFFQAQAARDSFKNLTVKDALAEDAAKGRLPAGQLRVDLAVRGLPSEKARSAYLVRLKGKGGQLLAPARSTYVNDFKQEGSTWGGTLVYYFEPLKAGLGATDRAELLLRTEADTSCAYSIPLDLSLFQ
ncbi:hypothetical protein K7W42_08635 [Deinococcus sp. HMF7604]|uniref:hypothetical protein n=1 Tax=Deinococcus betulae TaxID=2873312 RepID=UPI001CCC08C7|nr:hypothetical protein [Deinococcus betulae]MBZ9750927.1 hypothetical protein [Deinococcus betulae]